MRFFALACDYDGTIARDGVVDPATVEALREVAASGRRLLLVTGRQLDDLREVFAEHGIFDAIVAENGCVLYTSATKEEEVLAAEPPPEFRQALERAKIPALSFGRVIAGTEVPNEVGVIEVIRKLGLDLQVIFNKRSVMVVPSGVNKGTGLRAALGRLQLSPHNVAAIGDAENDHALLDLCEFSVAVANALGQVKETADFVTAEANGAGVRELCRSIVEDDLRALCGKVKGGGIPIGRARGAEVTIPVCGPNVLLLGSSGSGKSTLAKSFLEGLGSRGYQYCVIDPEGDYEGFEGALALGTRSRPPSASEVMQLLQEAGQNVVVNLLGVAAEQRPSFFALLLSDLLKLESGTGRPHWIVVDEAHHVFPREHEPGGVVLPRDMENFVFLTVEPERLQPEVLAHVGTVCAVGDEAYERLARFAKAAKLKPPAAAGPLKQGEAFIWPMRGRMRRFEVNPSKADHRRHRRKYAEGDVGPDLSFYFRGPEEKLNLRAQNLMVFSQTASGVDDATWRYHLSRGDYSRWFREVVKDEDLATEAEKVEGNGKLSAEESRILIQTAIDDRYTLPAEVALGK